MSERERPKLEWSDLKTFVDESTELAVRIQQGLGTGRPQYSVELGRMRENKFLKFLRMQYDTDDAGNVTVEPFSREAYDRLMTLAEEHVKAVQQTREAEFQAKRQEREERGGNDRGGGRGKRRVGTHGRYDGDNRGRN